MTELEQQVWIAVFANEFTRECNMRMQTPGAGSIDDISGYECGGVADVAVVKLREYFDEKGKEGPAIEDLMLRSVIS